MIQTLPNSNQEFQETEKRRNQATHHLCSSETKQMLFFMLPGYHKTMPINKTAITQLSTVSYNIKVTVLHSPILTSFYFILWFFFLLFIEILGSCEVEGMGDSSVICLAKQSHPTKMFLNSLENYNTSLIRSVPSSAIAIITTTTSSPRPTWTIAPINSSRLRLWHLYSRLLTAEYQNTKPKVGNPSKIYIACN